MNVYVFQSIKTLLCPSLRGIVRSKSKILSGCELRTGGEKKEIKIQLLTRTREKDHERKSKREQMNSMSGPGRK